MTTLPRFDAIETRTRVSRYSDSSSSSSSKPGGRSLATRAPRPRRSVRLAARPRRRRRGRPPPACAPTSPRPPPGGPATPGGCARHSPSSARAWPARQPAVGQEVLDGRRQGQQAQGVGDRHPALADPAGDLVVGEPEVVDQLLVAGCLVEGVEVLAVEVLDERLLHHGEVVGLADDGRDGVEARSMTGPPAALAGDELEPPALQRAHQDRLEHADLTDRRRQLAERVLVEGRPRLVGVGLDAGHRELLVDHHRGLGPVGRDQGPQPSTEPAAARHRSPPWPARGRRWPPARSDRRPGSAGRRTAPPRAARCGARRVRHTLSPKCARTSCTTWSASLVRASYITRMMVVTSSVGFSPLRTSSMFRRSWPSPSRA